MVAGCEFATEPMCTLELRHAIAVEVRDSVTGEPAAVGARLIVRDGVYADTSRQHGDPLLIQAGEERAGRYDVSVEKSGYREWTRENVRVTAGACHVRTVRLDVRLQPGS